MGILSDGTSEAAKELPAWLAELYSAADRRGGAKRITITIRIKRGGN
jgi:hypothetical protein